MTNGCEAKGGKKMTRKSRKIFIYVRLKPRTAYTGSKAIGIRQTANFCRNYCSN